MKQRFHDLYSVLVLVSNLNRSNLKIFEKVLGEDNDQRSLSFNDIKRTFVNFYVSLMAMGLKDLSLVRYGVP